MNVGPIANRQNFFISAFSWTISFFKSMTWQSVRRLRHLWSVDELDGCGCYEFQLAFFSSNYGFSKRNMGILFVS